MSKADDHFAIVSLMMQYCVLTDTGDDVGMKALLQHAETVDSPPPPPRPGEVVLPVAPHPPFELRPRQQHVNTNVSIAIADDGLTATGHSYYTYVLDLDGAARPVTSGTYDDRFAKVDGEWRFTRRVRTRQLGTPYRPPS